MKSLCLQREDADARMQSSQNFSKGRLNVEIDMKFALKSLVAAAAIVTVGLANAATASGGVGQPVTVTDPNGSGRKAELTLQSGSGTLYFSNGTSDPINGVPTTSVGGLVGALNIAQVKVSSVDGGVITERILPIGGRVKTDQRAVVSIDASVTRLTADTSTGQFTTVNAFGGAKQTALPLTGVLEGGDAQVFNLEIDLVGKRVFADTIALADDPAYRKVERLQLWTFETISGPTAIPPAALLAAADGNVGALTGLGFKLEGSAPGGVVGDTLYGTKLSLSTENILGGLRATTEGFNFFSYALGLVPGSIGYNTLANVNNEAAGWGSLKSVIRFTAQEVSPVPEPSTYAMMAIGLVGIGAMARRSRAAK